MEKLPIDLDNLPESVKNMVQNLDPEFIQNMLKMYDPATLSMMMNSMFSMVKDSLSPEQNESLQKMMDHLLEMMTKGGK